MLLPHQIVLDPIIPVPWIALAGAALFAATIRVYFQVGTRLGRWRNALLAASRLGAVSLVLIALLQPSRREEIPAGKASSVLLVGVDTSRSMKQADAAKNATRLQAAKDAVREAGLLAPGETEAVVKFFEFSEDARSFAPPRLNDLKADGATTNFHRSLQTMLASLQGEESARGIVLLTDGHDLELSGPAKTASAARSRRVPIYAAPFGAHGLVRDASAAITNFQPYCFVKQKARITGAIRVIGCEHETLAVQLVRQNKVVQTVNLAVGEQPEVPVDFEVSEPEQGQYEYEIRVAPLAQEADVKNNRALTYLNVIDQQIRVLMLEGAPYWDTGFLERSLFRNDKISLDAVLQYMPNKARRIRKGPETGELKIPTTRQEFEQYDVIILGRSVEQILSREQLDLLRDFVRDHGGAAVFSRGKAYDPPDELDPVTWADAADGDVSLQAGREGASMPALRTVAEGAGGFDAMPRLIGARRISERKTLAAILAEARNPNGDAAAPAMIHRRYGRGQVLSVAVEGLWRWSFHPKTTATNNAFDRFWDQLLVWLVASGDFKSSKPFSFRANTANLLLGEKIHLRLASNNAAKALREMPVTIYDDDKPVARTALTPASDGQPILRAEFLPEKAGRYRAVATMPDGQPQEVKWMVYEDNPEEKEVAADVPFLRALCESSGGRVLAPEELKPLFETLRKPAADLKPKVRMTSLWDQTWIFYLIGFMLALDWYLRRKWGLC